MAYPTFQGEPRFLCIPTMALPDSIRRSHRPSGHSIGASSGPMIRARSSAAECGSAPMPGTTAACAAKAPKWHSPVFGLRRRRRLRRSRAGKAQRAETTDQDESHIRAAQRCPEQAPVPPRLSQTGPTDGISRLEGFPDNCVSPAIEYPKASALVRPLDRRVRQPVARPLQGGRRDALIRTRIPSASSLATARIPRSRHACAGLNIFPTASETISVRSISRYHITLFCDAPAPVTTGRQPDPQQRGRLRRPGVQCKSRELSAEYLIPCYHGPFGTFRES